jgi:hypothetical protein
MARNSIVNFVASDVDKLVTKQDTSILKANLLNEIITTAINNEYKSSRSGSFAKPRKLRKKEKLNLKFGTEEDNDNKSNISIYVTSDEENNNINTIYNLNNNRKDSNNYSRYKDSFMNVNIGSPINNKENNNNFPDQLNDLSLSCINASNNIFERDKTKKSSGKFKKYTNLYKGKVIFLCLEKQEENNLLNDLKIDIGSDYDDEIDEVFIIYNDIESIQT